MNKLALFIGASALFAVAGVFALAFWTFRQEDAPNRADASDATLVARGEIVYQQHCASCHGVNLEGQPKWHRRNPDGTLPAPPHDDSGHTWHHSDEVLFQITKIGSEAYVGGDYKSNMPSFADTLDDRDIWASLAYIKSRWPADIQAEQERRSGGTDY